MVDKSNGLMSYSMLEDLLQDLVKTAPLKDIGNPNDRESFRLAWNAALNEMFRMHQAYSELYDRLFELQTIRPIASAPKDGTPILMLEEGEWYIVSWDDNEVFYPTSTRVPKCWCVACSFQDEQGGYTTIDNPEGWLPLPPAPVTEDK